MRCLIGHYKGWGHCFQFRPPLVWWEDLLSLLVGWCGRTVVGLLWVGYVTPRVLIFAQLLDAVSRIGNGAVCDAVFRSDPLSKWGMYSPLLDVQGAGS